MFDFSNPAAKPQLVERKPKAPVHKKRRRVGTYTREERKQIVFLFDKYKDDVDYVAERCGIFGCQRADVLAIVLGETRRKGPGIEPDSASGNVVPIRKIA